MSDQDTHSVLLGKGGPPAVVSNGVAKYGDQGEEGGPTLGKIPLGLETQLRDYLVDHYFDYGGEKIDDRRCVPPPERPVHEKDAEELCGAKPFWGKSSF